MITSVLAILTSWVTWLGIGSSALALAATAFLAPGLWDALARVVSPVAGAVGEKAAATIGVLWDGGLYILDNGRALAFVLVFGLGCYQAGQYVENRNVWAEIRAKYTLYNKVPPILRSTRRGPTS